jgi:hypothetical protein
LATLAGTGESQDAGNWSRKAKTAALNIYKVLKLQRPFDPRFLEPTLVRQNDYL